MYDSCLQKQCQIKEMFLFCPSEDDKYEKIIELGRCQRTLSEKYKKPENLVQGCQSQVYLHSYLSGKKVMFEAESDSIISAGLAALLTKVYSGEEPDTILKCPPTYLDELGIPASITPNRSNSLYNLHLRMTQDVSKLLA